MVSGFPSFIWLWNQPAKLHRLSKSLQIVTPFTLLYFFFFTVRFRKCQNEDDEVLIVFLPSSASVSHSRCVWIFGLEGVRSLHILKFGKIQLQILFYTFLYGFHKEKCRRIQADSEGECASSVVK